MRALVVSNMAPDAGSPERGGFVRDQVAALRGIDGVDVALHEFAPGAYRAAARELRRRHRGVRYDVVHAHFGLTAAPALGVRADLRAVTLHGRDLRHPRSRAITAATLPTQRLLGIAAEDLRSWLPRPFRARAVALPVGFAVDRFGPTDRGDARRRLGLDPAEPFLLFPYGRERRVKRFDRAEALAGAVGVPVRSLGGVDPTRMRDWLNAASVVVVPSEHEGFGLAAVEALACDVPVLATPTGAHPDTVGRVPGCLCAPWDLDVWAAAAREALRHEDPRVPGAAAAHPHGTGPYAARVVAAWRERLAA